MTISKDPGTRTVELALFTRTSVSRPRRVKHENPDPSGDRDLTCDRIPPPTQTVRIGTEAERLPVERAQPEFVMVEFRTTSASRSEPLADLSTLF